jgi:hypothetical protein
LRSRGLKKRTSTTSELSKRFCHRKPAWALERDELFNPYQCVFFSDTEPSIPTVSKRRLKIQCLLEILDDDELYSPRHIIKRAEETGVFVPNGSDEYKEQSRYAQWLLYRHIYIHDFFFLGDGVYFYYGGRCMPWGGVSTFEPAYYGWRWKQVIINPSPHEVYEDDVTMGGW